MGRQRSEGLDVEQQDTIGESVQWYLSSKTSTPMKSSRYIRHFKVTADEIHPDHPKSGGPFDSTSVTTEFSDGGGGMSGYYDSRYGGYGYYYNGTYRHITMNVHKPPSDLARCIGYGAEGWNKFRPAKPKVDLGQFLAELRDFPRLFKFELKKFKDLGDGYLNLQFGWKPFLSDIRNWFQSAMRLDAQIAQLREKNGKWERRGGTLFDTTLTSEKNITNQVYPSNYMQGYAVGIERTISTDKCWFDGAFRYYIPGLDSPKWGKFRAVPQLWGLDLTPKLLWEITPWSWLVDWVTNTGAVISNFTAAHFDNCAAKYAYIMLHRQVRREYSSSYKLWHFYDGKYTYPTGVASAKIVTDEKSRGAASPYGFSLDWDGFSAFQLSILSALGLSRTRYR